MNTTTQNTTDRNQSATTSDTRRDDEQFWANWWREYAKTWK